MTMADRHIDLDTFLRGRGCTRGDPSTILIRKTGRMASGKAKGEESWAAMEYDGGQEGHGTTL